VNIFHFTQAFFQNYTLKTKKNAFSQVYYTTTIKIEEKNVLRHNFM